MISEKELMDAIRQCEREPVTQSKIARLADFYIVYDHLFGEPYDAMYSGAGQTETVIHTNGESEFLRAVNGKKYDKVFLIIDELMEAVKVLHPRMHDGVLTKIYDI